MAPALTESAPTAAHQLNSTHSSAPRDIFPDGLKTTGQHPPLYDEIRPFDQFPKEITGRTLWHPDEYRNNPEKWTHSFLPEEIDELSTAADNFLQNKIPLTGISKVNIPARNRTGYNRIGHGTDNERKTSPSPTWPHV